MRTWFWKEIQAAAAKYALDPILVEAVVVQESAGNCDAFRFEKDFWNRLMKPQAKYRGLNPRRYSSSYGLMQIMWAVATERGWSPDLPPELLFVPETALDYGCRQLRHLFDLLPTKMAGPVAASSAELTAGVLASYNGGWGGNVPGNGRLLRNQAYASQVLAKYAQLATEHAHM